MNRHRISCLIVGLTLLVGLSLACGSSEGSGTQPTRTPLPRATCNPQSFSGRGDSVLELPDTLAGCTKAHLTHGGKSNFIVVPYDVNNQRLFSLVNEIGAYDGSVKWDGRTSSLEIKADGAWTIDVQS